jgi:hypothetical protein
VVGRTIDGTPGVVRRASRVHDYSPQGPGAARGTGGSSMRYEAVWLVQFLAAAAVIAVSFAVGMWAGWQRWGRRGPANWDSLRAEVEVQPVAVGRPDLFAPEVDLRARLDLRDEVRGELSPGT